MNRRICRTAARWTSPCTRAREGAPRQGTSSGSSPDVLGARGNLWVAVDRSGTTKSSSRWDDVRPSTIHSTYYNYYLNFVVLEVTESETA
jgi:hypothetical protein